MRSHLISLLLAVTTLVSFSPAATYFVSPEGDDSNPGTQSKPFQTMQKAAQTVSPGDTCRLQAGTYREAVVLTKSGRPDAPLRFVAEEGEAVTLDGTAPVEGRWTRHEGNIFKIHVDEPVEQLFADGAMMVEARWPNMRFDGELFDRQCWASTAKGSRHGTIKDPKLAETGIDWTGALITLNVAHQFFTWTRHVTSHEQGAETLAYPEDLAVITHYGDTTRGWDDDYYYLSGKLAALDVATEWFYDADEKLLYFYPPGGKHPSTLKIKYRVRQYAIRGEKLAHVELRGLRFFGCGFRFSQCSDMLIEDCRLEFPTYSRYIPRRQNPKHAAHRPLITGDRNTIRRCHIAFASHDGLVVTGTENLVEDCLIHDVCWNGSLSYVGLRISGQRSVARHNTIYNGGNALLVCPGGEHRVEYNHVYDGGRLCRDVSLIYTQLPRCRGTVIHHNWVHGCQTEGFRGRGRGGMGIRGDDQTRGLTVHHNVVWECGVHGIIVKGDENRVFNNTVFGVGPADPADRNERNSRHLLIPTREEPKKPWRKQFELLEVQNANSLFYNNAVGNLVWRGQPLPLGEKIANNLEFPGQPADAWLADPKNMDFRPAEDSPLIDAGREVPGYEGDYQGEAPDVGAYEYGAAPWKPGIRWEPKSRRR
jgi:hypothetical protein